jgi:tetratricopeptide (TPR) repeat protein
VRIVVRTSDKDSRVLPRAVLFYADACERAGRPGDARATLERALIVQPEDAQLAERLERVCEATGDHERLADLVALRAQRTADPREKTRLLLRAAGLVDQSRALPLLERARAADPENIEAALAYAKAQVASGRPREAAETLEHVALASRGKRLPVLAEVYLELGKARLAQDELLEAFDALKIGFGIDVRNGELAMLLGLLAVDLDDEKIAERALLAAATMPRRDGGVDRGEALYRLARMASDHGDRAKARRWAEKALVENSGHAGALEILERGAEPLVPRRREAIR